MRARLPSKPYFIKLVSGKEYSIASNHPIKPHLIAQMGRSLAARQACLERIYHEAEKVVIHVWDGKAKVASRSNPLSSLGLIVPQR